MMIRRGLWLVVGMVGVSAWAQDTRTVKEPVIPASCSVLTAELVGDHGVFSDADELKMDTARIQAAMDGCAKGKAVELKSDGKKNAFLAGPLHLRAGVVLLVDKGVTLYASRDPKDYELGPGTCGLIDHEKTGCKPFIDAVNATDSGIMGDGVIDGRAGSKVMGKSVTWWDIARSGKDGDKQQVPMLLTTDHADNFTLYRITLRNSAHFHFVPSHTNGVTVWGLKIDTPNGTPNTDGFDPSGSTNITIAYSYIRDGDDNLAIKAEGEPVTNMSVLHDHFYYGHGMSIGSGTAAGVNHLLVKDLSIDGAVSGIRIKSNDRHGGLVKDVTYEDVCVRDTKYPITLTTTYAWPGGVPGQIPVYQNILLRNVRLYGGGIVRVEGYDATRRIGIEMDGVMAMDGASMYKAHMTHTDLTLGPGPMNLGLAGTDSTVKGKAGGGKLEGCEGKFVGFPVVE